MKVLLSLETFYLFNFTKEFLETQAQDGFRFELILQSIYSSDYIDEVTRNPMAYDA